MPRARRSRRRCSVCDEPYRSQGECSLYPVCPRSWARRRYLPATVTRDGCFGHGVAGRTTFGVALVCGLVGVAPTQQRLAIPQEPQHSSSSNISSSSKSYSNSNNSVTVSAPACTQLTARHWRGGLQAMDVVGQASDSDSEWLLELCLVGRRADYKAADEFLNHLMEPHRPSGPRDSGPIVFVVLLQQPALGPHPDSRLV